MVSLNPSAVGWNVYQVWPCWEGCQEENPATDSTVNHPPMLIGNQHPACGQLQPSNDGNGKCGPHDCPVDRWPRVLSIRCPDQFQQNGGTLTDTKRESQLEDE